MSQTAATSTTSDTDIERAINGAPGNAGGVAAWVRATAHHHDIDFSPGPIDVFADAISRLSDAEVRLDTIEQLLLALERAGIVTGRQGVLLHAAYLRQKTR